MQSTGMIRITNGVKNTSKLEAEDDCPSEEFLNRLFFILNLLSLTNVSNKHKLRQKMHILIVSLVLCRSIMPK